ncbi:MAG TPA: 50S ribosomal protein L5 [Bacteroidales bacterium]|jgi:large subunit ribosomal protein L5|nr:50S ribosomal protein L5 [Bacteroidales bacterium]HNQ20017.1 50S ribosomal protein L5 [Bacteroidales bacterium]HNT70729.1 50S ribosomal protein L5 [Bacteroidales bacterium]HNY75148.1 50S ribosomal protein L5 [Bacteroidales bacterium]HOF06545.1 50S ribosomal protein L5 [Bacteroidales bacterium]
MTTKTYIPRLKKKYYDEVVPAMMKEFAYKNIMQVPKIEKIVVNQGIGEATQDRKLIEAALNELTMITGQKAIATYAKKDINNFKIRKGMPIGTKVTLRNDNMYEFLDRLISIAIPRIRDFHGINDNGFDGKGNFSFGINEQIIFPEINMDKVNKILGMDINIITTAKTDKEAYALLKFMGIPFRK